MFRYGGRRQRRVSPSPVHISNCVVNIQGGQLVEMCSHRGRGAGRRGAGRRRGANNKWRGQRVHLDCDGCNEDSDLLSNTNA